MTKRRDAEAEAFRRLYAAHARAVLAFALRRAGEPVSDRYQLGAAVTSAVACGWIDDWLNAQQSGDHAAEAAAVTAMQSSHHWAILQEMQSEGAWPQVLWEYADAMATGATVSGGKPLTIAESYANALGCRAGG